MNESIKKCVRFLVKNGLFPTCSGLDIVYHKPDIYLKGENNVLSEGQ